MKKFFLLSFFLLLSIVLKSQYITTNTVNLVESKEKPIIETNIFYFGDKFIQWTDSRNNTYIYYIHQIIELGYNSFIVHCITNGKLCTFYVNFDTSIINFGGLVFYKVDRL